MTVLSEELNHTLDKIHKKYEVSFEPLQIDNKVLEILTIHNMQVHIEQILNQKCIHNPLKQLPLWAKVWPGSFVLGRFLRKCTPNGKTLLELGAGCGILSIIAAQYGFKKITLSDISDDALLIAKANVLKNALQDSVDVIKIDVTNPCEKNLKKYDIIVASEILYLKEIHNPLIKFIEMHLEPSGKAIFCTDLLRKQSQFTDLARKKFQITEGHIGLKSTDSSDDKQTRVYNILILEHK